MKLPVLERERERGRQAGRQSANNDPSINGMSFQEFDIHVNGNDVCKCFVIHSALPLTHAVLQRLA